jgi:UDP-N-acetylmuramyl tripeptide synthase
MLQEATGEKPAYLTSVENFDGVELLEASLTTPETPETYGIFAKAEKNEIANVVMELSSQSDKMQRLVGMRYNYGIYTNISNDHLAPNEHHSFEEYLQCKMNIVGLYDNAVINLDDGHAKDAIEAAKNAKRVLTYSLDENAGADVYAKDIVKEGNDTRFTVVTPEWECEMKVTILGIFNVSNALAACAVACLMQLDPEKVAKGIEKTEVDGRMKIFENNGYVAVVDYAHNKASIYEACKAMKEYYPECNLHLVFGC